MQSILIYTPYGFLTAPLDSDRITLGRSTTADLSYPEDGELSRLHLAFERDGGGFSMRDLTSKNGTFVNGTRTSEVHVLQPNDRIECGHLIILYEPPRYENHVEFVDDGAAQTNAARIVTSLDGLIKESRQNGGTSQLGALIKAANELAGKRPLPELFKFILELSLDAVEAGRGVLFKMEKGELEE